MQQNSNIYLVGPMGSGKSAIGKLLAEELSRTFFDSDAEIIKQTGVSIDHIFDIEGENGFRVREEKMMQKLTSLNNIVLATGGGVVLSKQNRMLMENGTVVYLTADIDTLVERIKKSKGQNRPLLQGNNLQEKLSDILAKRDEIYRTCADITIDAKKDAPSIITRNIVETLQNNY